MLKFTIPFAWSVRPSDMVPRTSRIELFRSNVAWLMLPPPLAHGQAAEGPNRRVRDIQRALRTGTIGRDGDAVSDVDIDIVHRHRAHAGTTPADSQYTGQRHLAGCRVVHVGRVDGHVDLVVGVAYPR